MDIHITFRLVMQVLQYEGTQSGLNLTHTQDRNFIQVIILISQLINALRICIKINKI